MATLQELLQSQLAQANQPAQPAAEPSIVSDLANILGGFSQDRGVVQESLSQLENPSNLTTAQQAQQAQLRKKQAQEALKLLLEDQQKNQALAENTRQFDTSQENQNLRQDKSLMSQRDLQSERLGTQENLQNRSLKSQADLQKERLAQQKFLEQQRIDIAKAKAEATDPKKALQPIKSRILGEIKPGANAFADKKSIQDLRLGISAADTALAGLDRLKKLYGERGTGLDTLFGTGPRINDINSTRKNIAVTLNEVFKLGALSQGDLEILEAQIPDPSSRTPFKDVERQFERFEQDLQNRIKAKANSLGFETAPSKQEQDERAALIQQILGNNK